MKVKELSEILAGYPADAEIRVTWEGIFVDLKRAYIYLASTGQVVMDADDEFMRHDTKQKIMSGKKKVY